MATMGLMTDLSNGRKMKHVRKSYALRSLWMGVNAVNRTEFVTFYFGLCYSVIIFKLHAGNLKMNEKDRINQSTAGSVWFTTCRLGYAVDGSDYL